MPETNHMSRVNSFAANAWLNFIARVMLLTKVDISYLHIAFPAAGVHCPVWLFCSGSFMSYFRGVLIRYMFY
jgi:hypothetical protein